MIIALIKLEIAKLFISNKKYLEIKEQLLYNSINEVLRLKMSCLLDKE